MAEVAPDFGLPGFVDLGNGLGQYNGPEGPIMVEINTDVQPPELLDQIDRGQFALH